MVIAKFDYDKYYSKLLINALKYGMTRNEFWYGEDYKDYFLYEQAYYEKLHEQSHIRGQYFYIGLVSIISNFNKDKSKQVPYPEKNLLVQATEEQSLKKKYNDLKKGGKKEINKYRNNLLKNMF